MSPVLVTGLAWAPSAPVIAVVVAPILDRNSLQLKSVHKRSVVSTWVMCVVWTGSASITFTRVTAHLAQSAPLSSRLSYVRGDTICELGS
jgi:hypothetical protein